MPQNNISARPSAAVQAFFLRSGGPVSAVGNALQRKSTLQMRPGMEAFQVNLRPRSGGLPLPKDVQAKMEKALSANFSDVRVHVGPEAASIGAMAFTWGTDIHFAPGQYNPHTPQGQFLLGHELAHVVQQRAGRVLNPFGGGVAVVQDHALEAEADRLGRLAANGHARETSAMSASGASTGGGGTSSVINQKPAAPTSYNIGPAMRHGSSWQIQAACGGANCAGSVRLTPDEGKGVYISDLEVAPEHRRHGVAKQLVQAAMRTARTQGFAVAQLEARPGKDGIAQPALVAMYQRLGFRTTRHSQRGSPVMERVI